VHQENILIQTLSVSLVQHLVFNVPQVAAHNVGLAIVCKTILAFWVVEMVIMKS
jgi:hypothetical protein